MAAIPKSLSGPNCGHCLAARGKKEPHFLNRVLNCRRKPKGKAAAFAYPAFHLYVALVQ